MNNLKNKSLKELDEIIKNIEKESGEGSSSENREEQAANSAKGDS